MIEAVLSARGLAVCVGAPGRAGRPGPLPRAVRARLADHLTAVAPERPDMARATLHALATSRRTRRPQTSRRPGRSGTSSATRRRRRSSPRGGPPAGEFRYYGTADATPWFLVLLAATGSRASKGRRAAAGGWGAGWTRGAGWCVTNRGARARPAGLARHDRRGGRRLTAVSTCAPMARTRAAAGRRRHAGRGLRGAAGGERLTAIRRGAAPTRCARC